MDIKIDDVARLAGVSVPTVSRVLNRSKYVSPALEKRVLDAVRILNFTPNLHAKGLASRNTNTIGLIVSSIDESHMANFINSCSIILDSRKYTLMIGKTTDDTKTEQDLLNTQINSRVSGIITSSASRKTANLLTKEKIPAVFIYNEAPLSHFHSLVFDEYNAAGSLIKLIAGADKKTFVVLSGSSGKEIIRQRVEGCEDAFRELGTKRWKITECPENLDGGYGTALALFKDSIPDVLVCMNDFIAIGALRAAFESGIKVPEQMEVTGFESTIFSDVCTPTLTTVKFDNEKLGEIATETIIGILEGKEFEKKRQLGYEIISGNSCILMRED